MGLISTALISAGSVLSDQWKEYFYCDSIPADVLVVKGKKRNRNNRGNDNIISNGSIIAISWFGANMIVAGVFGFLVPLVLDKIHADPAVASSIFVTTATDVLGFFIFLGLSVPDDDVYFPHLAL